MKIFYYFSIWFCLGSFFVFFLRLATERRLPWRVRGSPAVSGPEVAAPGTRGSGSLAHSVSRVFSSFKIGIFHVEPAKEDSEN